MDRQTAGQTHYVNFNIDMCRGKLKTKVIQHIDKRGMLSSPSETAKKDTVERENLAATLFLLNE